MLVFPVRSRGSYPVVASPSSPPPADAGRPTVPVPPAITAELVALSRGGAVTLVPPPSEAEDDELTMVAVPRSGERLHGPDSATVEVEIEGEIEVDWDFVVATPPPFRWR
jgi:hypothetical protein